MYSGITIINIFYPIICCSFLIVGLPTIIIGCNDTLCPLQVKLVGQITSNYYVEATCQTSYCTSYNTDETCTSMNYYTYDCSYWASNIYYMYHDSYHTCSVRGKYTEKSPIAFYFNKLDNVCTIDLKTINNLHYVGIVFIILSGLSFILWMYAILLYCVSVDV